MDQSLDDIIKTNRTKSRKPHRARSARTSLGKGAPAVSPAAKARKAANASTPVTTTPQPADKIIVSNLPLDVNEAQVKELFSTTVGPLREVNMHYDAAGKSKGVATVQFSKRGDGTKAYNQYNNRLIDGKRPMKIEVVVDPSKAPAVPLASRVAPPASNAAPASMEGVQRTGGGRPRKRGPRTKRPQKTVADLDAEMEDYTNSTGTAAAAPAPPAATM